MKLPNVCVVRAKFTVNSNGGDLNENSLLRSCRLSVSVSCKISDAHTLNLQEKGNISVVYTSPSILTKNSCQLF